LEQIKIYLSPLAAEKLKLLAKYLSEEWGAKSKETYLNRLKQKFDQIARHPKSCPTSRIANEIRKCIVTKQSSFYYRIINNEIEVITFFDNRQNQEALFVELKNVFDLD